MRERLYRLFPATLLLCLLLFAAAPQARAQPPRVLDAAETALALKRLGVMGGALYIAAHPDDENTAMLAYLASQRGVRTAYLSVTRGDGGQNLIGSEKGEQLGVIRTQELLAARRIDGAEQFFTRAVDFGFSKSPEEALRVWGHDAVLADVVWVVRRFRPDVMIARFPTTGEGGHGHHTASAILAREAFEAAGDPSRFPEQLRHVRVWRPKRLLWNVFRFQPGDRLAEGGKLVSVDVGAYNPLLGQSYTEVAAQSRSQHKSQGFGSSERRGTSINYLAHLAGEEPAGDLFDGVDLTWGRIPGGDAVGRLIAQAAREYQPANPQAVLPLLVSAHRELSKLAPGDPLVESKRAELLDVIRAASGLWVEAVAAEPYVVPGSDLKVTFTLVNRSEYPLRIESVSIDGGPAAHGAAPATSAAQVATTVGQELKPNQPTRAEAIFKTPARAAPSQPYWLAEEGGAGLFRIADQRLIGLPETHAFEATVMVAAGPEGERLAFRLPVQYRWTDRVQGELYRPVAVVPRVAVSLEEQVLVFPDAGPKQLRVTLRNNAGAATSGTLRLRLPQGWSARPASVPVELKSAGEESKMTFTVAPASGARAGAVVAELDSGGVGHARGMIEIDYPHIPRQMLFPEAAARLVPVELKRRGRLVGYVMGSGDEVPEALRQVGYEVVLLSDEDLDAADLSRFDAVVTGVRAYNTRARLRLRQPRLLEYVERGGTLVVQYNTADRSLEGVALGPYPFKLSSERVTVEQAPVEFLAADDPLMTGPNRITAADFDGWVQERGLYFPSEWDARYRPLFASADPGERQKSGLTLVARHGRGTYIYTPLAWFRQLPAGVPGAYRIFVNLVSAGGKDSAPGAGAGERR
jgi:LmbE family N-acetylglucosaminyl deacetylase